MLISRSRLLRAALAGAAYPGLAHAIAAGPTAEAGQAGAWTQAPGGRPLALRFVVIGDNTGVARPGVFDAAMRQIAWLAPDFVLSVGDLIEGYTEDRDEIARQWGAIEASIAKAGRPFVFTPGNHDVDNAETLDAWRSRRGPGYYSFTCKGALFIILNTEDTPTPMSPKAAASFYDLVRLMQSDPDRAERETEARLAGATAHGEGYASQAVDLGDRQLAFVKSTLERHPRPVWTFVSIHKPAWKMHSPDFDQVRAMLSGRPHTVFAGHTHYFTHDVFDGHHYINMGVTGGVRHRDGPGTMDNLLLVTLDPEGPRFGNIRFSGLMDLDAQTGQTRAY